MKNTILVQLDEKQVEVKKLPIGGYVDLIRAVKKLPAHLVKIKDLDRQEIVGVIPDLVAEALPDLVGVIAAGVKMSKDEISELGLHEIIKLVEAFLSVNHFDEISATIKKVIALPTIQDYAQKAQVNQSPSTT